MGRAAEAVDWDEADEGADDRRHKKISVLFESFTANHAADRIRTEHRRALEEIAVLTGAIQEQQESMQAENTALRAELDETRKMVESLATQVEALQERETMTQSKTSAVDTG